jgi:hypothetical protein
MIGEVYQKKWPSKLLKEGDGKTVIILTIILKA